MTNNNFRQYTLTSGKTINSGKNSEQNDLLVLSSKRNDTLLHTQEPGSPFVNLGENPTRNEIKEAAVFCAIKSQDWRNNHSNIKVNVFKKDDCSKSPKMKSGSWSVKKYSETINVKESEILKLENELAKF